MCIAVPMKIIEIDQQACTGKVVFLGSEMTVSLRLVSPKVGDYVLVHAGCAIEIVQQDTAEEILDIYEEIEGYAHGS